MKLRRILVAVFTLALWLFAAQGIATALQEDWLAAGDPLPEITLLSPENPAHKEYLGLGSEGSFQIPDIKAEVVIVEIFSMYCPHCQKEAPAVNKLYEMIENHPTAKGKVKLIGIGARNDMFEVDFFRKKYEIAFPLFDDEDYTKHEACGEPGTSENVYWNAETMTATVSFNIQQNATADGTIDPTHIEFKFSGQDIYGNTMDEDFNQFSGFSGVA